MDLKNWDFLFRRRAPEPANPHVDLREAEAAKRFLDDPAFSLAMRRVREGIHLAWANSELADDRVHERLRLMLKLLDDLEGNLLAALNDGRLAEAQLKDERRLAEMKHKREKQVLSRII